MKRIFDLDDYVLSKFQSIANFFKKKIGVQCFDLAYICIALYGVTGIILISMDWNTKAYFSWLLRILLVPYSLITIHGMVKECEDSASNPYFKSLDRSMFSIRIVCLCAITPYVIYNCADTFISLAGSNIGRRDVFVKKLIAVDSLCGVALFTCAFYFASCSPGKKDDSDLKKLFQRMFLKKAVA